MEDTKTFIKSPGWEVNGRPLGFGTSPEADWKIILVSTAVLSVLVIILSVYMFIKIDKGEIFVAEKSNEEETKALDTGLLRETVLYYEHKAAEFERIKSTRTFVADPSL
ncbi:MAG: hypothetical protein WD896_00045 [Parcubacteria group bacterium]